MHIVFKVIHLIHHILEGDYFRGFGVKVQCVFSAETK